MRCGTTDPSWVVAVFEPRPDQWGLRGDPFLWDELGKALRTVDSPANSSELLYLLRESFERLVGMPITHPEDVYVERFAHGGMSSGFVCMQFWRELGLPLLCRRLDEYLRGEHGREGIRPQFTSGVGDG